ncbi:MAG: CPBP family intramembrane glutamic endopeptidase [Henriciella sp.]|uniref:CPBP family intramembrane glutamic endopeptidase n=1 Tax=Henriciella sp. TaxID=1968823 RepID=UPI0032EB2BB5
MQSGPYNTPMALHREPFSAIFWVILAPFLIPVVGSAIITVLWPGYYDIIQDPGASREAIGQVWMLLAMVQLVYFGLLTLWAERVGAGAFAGDMRASQNWIIAAILLGPVILLAPNLIMSSLFGGEEGWQYSGDVNTALFLPQNWGASYLIYALVLAPLVEEVTYRGVAMGALLVRGVPPVMAMVVSSAAFTFVHLQYSIPALIVVFLAAMGFAWLRLKSGTILVPILAHMSANGLITFIASLAPPPAG